MDFNTFAAIPRDVRNKNLQEHHESFLLDLSKGLHFSEHVTEEELSTIFNELFSYLKNNPLTTLRCFTTQEFHTQQSYLCFNIDLVQPLRLESLCNQVNTSEEAFKKFFYEVEFQGNLVINPSLEEEDMKNLLPNLLTVQVLTHIIRNELLAGNNKANIGPGYILIDFYNKETFNYFKGLLSNLKLPELIIDCNKKYSELNLNDVVLMGYPIQSSH